MEGMDRYVYPLGKATLLVGRRGESDIQLPSENIDQNHASIIYDNGNFFLRDNGSANGSFVNGEPVTRRVIKHMDLVRFGAYLFIVNFVDEFVDRSALPTTKEVQLDANAHSGKATKNLGHLSVKMTAPVQIKKSILKQTVELKKHQVALKNARLGR